MLPLKELRIAERSPDKSIERQAGGQGQIGRRLEHQRKQQSGPPFRRRGTSTPGAVSSMAAINECSHSIGIALPART